MWEKPPEESKVKPVTLLAIKERHWNQRKEKYTWFLLYLSYYLKMWY